MNLLHLQYFYEVARTGSVTAAARKLRVSQPAVSKQIKLLEGDFGGALLLRTRQGVKLTESGLQAFEAASKIFSEVNQLSARMKDHGSELGGSFSLGVSDNLAIHVIPAVAAYFQKRHPNVRLQLFSGTSAQIKEEMRLDRCEAGVFYTPLKASELYDAEVIAQAEFLLVIRSSHSWLKKHPATLASLRKSPAPRVSSRLLDYSDGIPAHFHLAKLGLTDEPSIQVNHHEVQKRLVLEGAGFAALTRHSVRKELADGTLRVIRTPQPLLSSVFWVTPRGRPVSRASVQFREILKERRRDQGLLGVE